MDLKVAFLVRSGTGLLMFDFTMTSLKNHQYATLSKEEEESIEHLLSKPLDHGLWGRCLRVLWSVAIAASLAQLLLGALISLAFFHPTPGPVSPLPLDNNYDDQAWAWVLRE